MRAESRWAAMPDPTTAITRNAVPTSSATARRASGVTRPRRRAARPGRRGPRAHAVVDPDAALAPVEQADLVQHLEVVADRRLGEVEGVVEVADAGLLVGVRRDQGEQPQPHRVGQRLEQRRDPLGLVGAERLLGQRGAAGDRARPGSSSRAETSTCIYIDRHRCLVATSRHRHSSICSGAAMSRLQLALNVDDLEQSIAFYTSLFGTEPAKVKPGYANFAVAEPPLKLVLIENPGQRRLAQPPRRRGRRHRHRRRRADPSRRRPVSPRSTSATPPAATPSRTSSGSRAPPTASAGRSTPSSRTPRTSASTPARTR